jgi:hypothetical protein
MNLFVGNFDFEYHLGARTRQAVPMTVQKIAAELATAWIAVADHGDYVWVPQPVEAGFFERLQAAGLPQVIPVQHQGQIHRPLRLCPWGWTDGVRRWGERMGCAVTAPPQPAVREANSRRWSSALEREWEVDLPGAATVHSMEQLAAAVANLPKEFERWVVKSEFSMSARERVIGSGRELPAQSVAWIRRRLVSDGVLFFEPWVERIEEVGLQFDIAHPGGSGGIVLEGITPLLTDANGNYRGSRFSPDPSRAARWCEAIDIGRRAAERILQLGYFGPVGIDAMRYRTRDGAERIRPLQDINARYTMGRLSLGFRRLLKPGEQGVWLHLLRPKEPAGDRYADAQAGLPPSARVIKTSPDEIGGRPCGLVTILVLAQRTEALHLAGVRDCVPILPNDANG